MADVPSLKINPNAAREPGIIQLPTPRVADLQVGQVQVTTPQIAQLPSPLRELSNSLSRVSDETNEVAKIYAKQEGLTAVMRDDEGNLVVKQAPYVGDAAIAFHAGVKYSALSQAEAEAKREDLVISKQYHQDPDGYLQASKAFRDKHVAAYAERFGPDVGAPLARSIDQDVTQNYRALVNEKQRTIRHNFDQGTLATMASTDQDMTTLIRSGGSEDSPEFKALFDRWMTANKLRIQNPILAEDAAVGALRTKELVSKLEANRFLYNIDQVYKNKAVGADGQPLGGRQAALDAAKNILTDQSLKISPKDREAYYHKAVGEIHANDAIRRMDLYEAHAAVRELQTASSLGLRIDPEMVNGLAQHFYKLDDPGSAARLYAWAGRAPLNDDFGRQPLPAQTAQLSQIKSSYPNTPENQAAIRQAATNLGVNPRDLAAAISYETKGTFNPAIVGGAGNNYRGLIQFGPEEQKKYGITPGQSFPEQMKAVESFLRDRGVKPGMGLSDIYRTIIGGNPNAPLTARDQNGTIAEHIGNIQNAHYTNADRFLGTDQSAANPAQALWLGANRQRTVNDQATKGWAFMMNEWKEKGITPNPETTRAMIEAARVTGNHALLEQISADLNRVNIVKEAAEGPLASQHASIAQLRQMAGSGDLSVGNAAVLKQLEQKNAAIEKGLAENPISTVTANFPDKMSAPGPLNVADQAAFRAGLSYRARVAQFGAQAWQTKALPALDKADVEGLQATLEKADPQTRARIFSDITAAIPDERTRNATFGKFAEKGEKAAVMAYAGALYGQAPDTAASILRGQHAMEVDERNNPAKEGEGKEAFNTALDKVLPPGAFSLAGRTDPQGPYTVMRNAVIARYADLTAQDPTSKRTFDEKRLKQAAEDVTGGVLSHNGGSFIAPQRGMSQSDFDRVLWGVTDQDMAGATTLVGEPVTAAYLRGNAQLESYGDGRYLVRLGRDPARPAYAVRGANTEMPTPFVLDLRGRKPGEAPPSGVAFQPYPRG